jgi:glutamyl-tRNA synthetase
MLRITPNFSANFNLQELQIVLLTYIISKQKNEDIIIRLNDINKTFYTEEKEKKFLEILSYFSINYTQVIHQSSTFKYHQQIAMQLLVDKKAFNCFCSDKTLEKESGHYNGFCENLHDETVLNVNAPFRVRIKKPIDNSLDCFVILNQDKSPSLDFANGVDDMLNNISTVICTEDEKENTFNQSFIRTQIGYDQDIQYIFIPKLKNDNIDVATLIEDGYLPAAISNYLFSLIYETPKEIFDLEEAIEWFDNKKLNQSEQTFDLEKLQIINKKHIELIEPMRLSKILGYADDDIGKLAKLYIEDEITIKNIKNKIDFIFSKKPILNGYEEQYTILQEFLADVPYMDDLDELKMYITLQVGLKGDKLNTPLTYLLTGDIKGPSLDLVYPYIKNYLGEIVC